MDHIEQHKQKVMFKNLGFIIWQKTLCDYVLTGLPINYKLDLPIIQIDLSRIIQCITLLHFTEPKINLSLKNHINSYLIN